MMVLRESSCGCYSYSEINEDANFMAISFFVSCEISDS